MTLLTIDSCVYLSAFLSHDFFHQASKRFLEQMAQSKAKIILPSLIPLEVSNTLRRQGLNTERALEILNGFYNTKRTQIVTIDKALSLSLMRHISYFNLKTADWIIAGTCLEFKCQLITWDQTLLQATQTLLRTSTPESIPVK